MIIDSPPPYQDATATQPINNDEKSSSPLNPVPLPTQSQQRRSSSSASTSPSPFLQPPPFQDSLSQSELETETDSSSSSSSSRQKKYISFRLKSCRKTLLRLSFFFVILLAFISLINLSIIQSLTQSLLVYLDSFLPKSISKPLDSISNHTLKPVFNLLLGPRIATTSYTFLLGVVAFKGKVAMKEAMMLKKVLEEYRYREWERRERERERERELQSGNGILNEEEEQLVSQVESRQ